MTRASTKEDVTARLGTTHRHIAQYFGERRRYLFHTTGDIGASMSVYAFSQCRFSPSDLALFRPCFDQYRARRGWDDWQRQTETDFDVITIHDAVAVTHLSLARRADGQYLAFDDDDEEVADAPTLRDLLPQVGMTPARTMN